MLLQSIQILRPILILTVLLHRKVVYIQKDLKKLTYVFNSLGEKSTQENLLGVNNFKKIQYASNNLQRQKIAFHSFCKQNR